jgi:hypothetical protein
MTDGVVGAVLATSFAKGVLDGGLELGGAVFGVFSGVPAESETVVFGAGDDVEMNVHDDLAGGGTVVLEDVDGFGSGGGLDGGDEGREMTGEGGEVFGRHFVDGGEVSFWDEEGVAFGDGVDVEEGDGVRGVKDGVRWEYACGYFAENAIG